MYIIFMLYFQNKYSTINFVISLFIYMVDDLAINLYDKFHNELVRWM